MSGRLDPEDLKGITSRIFGDVAKVDHKCEGFVEKYAGDTLNVAARLSSAAGLDEILVGREVYRQGLGHFLNGEVGKARASFEEVAVFNEECGVEEIGTPAKTLSGGFLLSTGELKRGLKMIEDCRKRFE
jgi:hypothetical protein